LSQLICFVNNKVCFIIKWGRMKSNSAAQCEVILSSDTIGLICLLAIFDLIVVLTEEFLGKLICQQRSNINSIKKIV
jgi:hypothetical protein